MLLTMAVTGSAEARSEGVSGVQSLTCVHPMHVTYVTYAFVHARKHMHKLKELHSGTHTTALLVCDVLHVYTCINTCRHFVFMGI